jgi:TDG/mug DNA glycosylase family protein
MKKHISRDDLTDNALLLDIVAPGLDVLFCGINPGLLAAATGYPFAGRGNRFWRTLHLSGFTPSEFAPCEGRRLLELGYGITSVIERATAGARDLSSSDFAKSREAFLGRVTHHSPRYVAFLGKAGLAGITGRTHVSWGDQHQSMANSKVWLLPNPSGRNLSFSLDELVHVYALLRSASSGR